MALIKVSALKTLVQSAGTARAGSILEQAVTSRGSPDGGGIHGDSIKGLLEVGCGDRLFL